MPYFMRILFFISLPFVLASCAERMQPIYNAENLALPPIFETASSSDIASAIESGAKDAGWKVKTIGPQELEATLKIRVHTAIVRIPFSQSNYSIIYKTSTNLPYTGTRIHKNYNIWIERLQTQIGNSLQLKATQIRTAKSEIGDDPEVAWENVKDSESVAVLREFLRKHQDSPYAPKAIERLNSLAQEQQLALNVAPKKPKPQRDVLTEPFFNAEGRWQVIANYYPDSGGPSWCMTGRTWRFSVEIRQGTFSKTAWDRGQAIYFEGAYDAGEFDLEVQVPNGGGNWRWNERPNLDRDSKVFSADSLSTGGRYGACTGKIDVRMDRKTTFAPQAQSKQELRESNNFDVTGNWRVNATYLPFSASTTSCSPKRHWNFSFFFRKGITTRTVWSNDQALYITAENSPNFVDLKVEVPNGGSNWQWSERLNIDKKIVFLKAEAASTSGSYGNCIGTIEVRMEKLD